MVYCVDLCIGRFSSSNIIYLKRYWPCEMGRKW